MGKMFQSEYEKTTSRQKSDRQKLEKKIEKNKKILKKGENNFKKMKLKLESDINALSGYYVKRQEDLMRFHEVVREKGQKCPYKGSTAIEFFRKKPYLELFMQKKWPIPNTDPQSYLVIGSRE